MELGERLKKARGTLSAPEFCRPLSLHKNTLYGYEKGTSVPDATFLADVCRHYGISPAWLLLGDGPMEMEAAYIYIGEGETEGRGEGRPGPLPGADPAEFDLVPMVETRLSAGNGSFVLSENVEGYYAFRKSWVRSVAASARDLVLMRVDGDSMNPTIRSGDTVMIDASRRTIIEGQVFALRVDDTIMIKRLSYRPGGRVLVGSDNRQEFDPYEVDLADMHVLGQIIFFSRVLINI